MASLSHKKEAGQLASGESGQPPGWAAPEPARNKGNSDLEQQPTYWSLASCPAVLPSIPSRKLRKLEPADFITPGNRLPKSKKATKATTSNSQCPIPIMAILPSRAVNTPIGEWRKRETARLGVTRTYSTSTSLIVASAAAACQMLRDQAP